MADLGSNQANNSPLAIWLARVLFIGLVGLLLLYYTGRDLLASTMFIAMALLLLFTSFTAPIFTLINSVVVVVYFISLQKWIVCDAHSSKTLLPLIAFFAFISAILSIRGPFYFWLNFWTNDIFRILLCSISSVCILGHFYLVLSQNMWKASAKLATTIGLLLVFYAGVFIVGGFENMLAYFNDELLMIPGMTSRILGITTHLNIPMAIPHYVLLTGVSIFAIGILSNLCINRK